jgi:hypothetical protein
MHSPLLTEQSTKQSHPYIGDQFTGVQTVSNRDLNCGIMNISQPISKQTVSVPKEKGQKFPKKRNRSYQDLKLIQTVLSPLP